MKHIEVKKMNREEVTNVETLNEGIVAFQMVKFTYDFYGKAMTDFLDTKIMADGRQIVIDGNGFIKAGFVLTI